MDTPLLPLNLSGQAAPVPTTGGGEAWCAAAPHGPSPRGSNRVHWAVGGGILGLLALCCIGCAGLGLLLGAGGLARTTAARDAGRAAVAYFEALGAHDWPRAHDALSAGPRATTTPANLRATWTQREATRGALDRFVAEGVSLDGSKHATVRGVLHYKGAGEDAMTVQLVEEGGAWKVASVVTGPRAARAAQLPSRPACELANRRYARPA